MKTFLFSLLFASVLYGQSYQRQSVSNAFTSPIFTVDSLTVYHWDIHNYGPDSIQIKVSVPKTRDSSYTLTDSIRTAADSTRTVRLYFRIDSLYPAIPPGATVNYNFSMDSTYTLPEWKAIHTSANIFYRVHK